MMLEQVAGESELLRRLVVRDDFAGAGASARRYAGLVEDQLKCMSLTQGTLFLEEACRLLEGERRSLCASRARLSGELRRVQGITAYYQAAQPDTVHTWRFNG